ncbi:MAG: PTS sugar transporter subunit IIC, partial [Lachnospiraceae bacterium]|nr:PTS sugar transporter subunit IIC [Lachnospiraceae bacterium]
MKKIKGILHEIFIDGLSGMAIGLFATLIIGTIINQIAGWIPGIVGDSMLMMGKVASAVTGAGIGIGCAVKLKAKPLTTVSSAVAGMVGAFASKLLAGSVLVEG